MSHGRRRVERARIDDANLKYIRTSRLHYITVCASFTLTSLETTELRLRHDATDEVLVHEVPFPLGIERLPRPLERLVVRVKVQTVQPRAKLSRVHGAAPVPIQLAEHLDHAPLAVHELLDLLHEHLLQAVTVQHVRRRDDVRRFRVVVRVPLPVPVDESGVVLLRDERLEKPLKVNLAVFVRVVVLQDLHHILVPRVDVHAVQPFRELRVRHLPVAVRVEILEHRPQLDQTAPARGHPPHELLLELLHRHPLRAVVHRGHARAPDVPPLRRRLAMTLRSRPVLVPVQAFNVLHRVNRVRRHERFEHLEVVQIPVPGLVVLIEHLVDDLFRRRDVEVAQRGLELVAVDAAAAVAVEIFPRVHRPAEPRRAELLYRLLRQQPLELLGRGDLRHVPSLAGFPAVEDARLLHRFEVRLEFPAVVPRPGVFAVRAPTLAHAAAARFHDRPRLRAVLHDLVRERGVVHESAVRGVVLRAQRLERVVGGVHVEPQNRLS
eukprot:17590-Pelagococcus_subviridis.AAC.4